MMLAWKFFEKPEVEPPEKDDTVQDDIDLEVPEDAKLKKSVNSQTADITIFFFVPQ